MTDREQLYEAFDSGIIGLDDIIDISQKDGHIQALENFKKYILNSCNNVTCREDINTDNDFDFYASELLDMIEEMKDNG